MASLRGNRTFVLLFAAQLISLLGSGATTIGLALFAYRLAGAEEATALLGNALMLRILAFLVFSQPAGVLADRWPRKRILIGSDLLRAGLLGLLPFATAVWHVYVLIFILNALTAFFTQAYAQVFLASGHYSQFGAFPIARSGIGHTVHRDELRPTVMPSTNPDFINAALNANIVLRWEYSLASTLFFVYTRAQTPAIELGPTDRGHIDASALGKAPATDTLLLKLTHFFG